MLVLVIMLMMLVMVMMMIMRMRMMTTTMMTVAWFVSKLAVTRSPAPETPSSLISTDQSETDP